MKGYLFTSPNDGRQDNTPHQQHGTICSHRSNWTQWHLKTSFNTLRPRQDGRHFPDDIFKCILLYENIWIWLKISMKFVPKGSINNILALVQIMAWCRPGDKPLFGPMMVRLPTHVCVTRPQWVNTLNMFLSHYFRGCVQSGTVCKLCSLTHCGQVTPHGNIDLSQHWPRWWFLSRQHQVTAWTNVGLTSFGIHQREISGMCSWT